jgi:hypothetical protein
VYFTHSRGADPGLSVLELSQLVPETLDTVTPEAPLKLSLEVSLAEGEYILPIAFDGEFFLPLGRSHATPQGTEVRLERLPLPLLQSERSLGGAVRIFFQKVFSSKLGLAFDYPQLGAMYVLNNGRVVYEKEPAVLRPQIAEAKRILLLIHGLLGDTPTLMDDLRADTAMVQHLRKHYDLILGFDYESFNTPVEETARQLKQCLEFVGLHPQCPQRVDIVGYELGGLVGRWFVEREGGNAVVNHLIMLGTPHGGTPWSTVERWALVALGFGLNSLSTVAWPVKVIGSLVAAIEAFDVTLDQMQPGSALLKSLAASPDPGVPYSVVAGHGALPAAALALDKHGSSPLQRLLQKLGSGTANLAFLGQPNDLFASVYSLKGIEPIRQPALNIRETGCDHFTYLAGPDGRQVLMEVLQP